MYIHIYITYTYAGAGRSVAGAGWLGGGWQVAGGKWRVASDGGCQAAAGGWCVAGAGVAGLALGFGAQKLVADVLSGIFYLVDDAFRVGEYIEAGGVSGSVEAITLRNVMLRHHRGMLQIVPFSDLGSITNFMRGGIIVKFNLQFPYDTNIDKVVLKND